MEVQTPWLVCRAGKKCNLLAKDDNAFYIIEVGKNLDWETEEWLQNQGITADLLKELKLAFTYIPRKDIRGVAFSGCEAGDRVYLYLRSEKRMLTLEDDYAQTFMDTFFENLNRFTPPKQKTPGDKGWRKEYQDKATFEKLTYGPLAFVVSGLAAGFGWLMTRHWLIYTLCLGLCVLQIGLALIFPVYFTMFLPKGRKKQNVYDIGIPLMFTGAWLLIGPSGSWMDFSALRWIIPLSIGVAAVIYWRVRDLHEEPWGFLSCLLVCFCITFVLAGRVNMVYDFTPGESWMLEVEGLRSTGGRNDHHYCTVTLPDGTVKEIHISEKLYRELEEGDFVRVEQNVGALGMEYTQVYRMK